jgi:hypothetical protein
MKKFVYKTKISHFDFFIIINFSDLLLCMNLIGSGIILAFISVCLLCEISVALNNGLGRTPQMGWSSWNHFHCNISEELIKSTADKLVELGLDKKGYKYVNLDDCWQI